MPQDLQPSGFKPRAEREDAQTALSKLASVDQIQTAGYPPAPPADPVPLTAAERAALPVLARGACLRFALTRAWDWLNTPADALVTRKDPIAYVRRLDWYRAHPEFAA